MKPKNNFLEITPLKDEEKKGAIILPGTVNATHKKGVIKAVSDQVTGYKAGDKIIYFKRGIVADFPEFNSEFIRHDQILCII